MSFSSRKVEMNSPTTEIQTTLLTGHKGVDLHAASALLVMRERLAGGEHLVDLLRCELHTFWGSPAGWDVARLLATGRYYNPNKHHFGIFTASAGERSWLDGAEAGRRLPATWPGTVSDTDLPGYDENGPDGLYRALLGGPVPDDCAPCDVVSFAYGQEGPVLSGVLWRLVIRGDAARSAAVGEQLAVARHRKEGLLVNPHMECWFTVGA